jgi:CheY-like chemotaxis protein
LVEQLPFKQRVEGSSPSRLTWTIDRSGSPGIPNWLGVRGAAVFFGRKTKRRNDMNRPLAFIVEDNPDLSEISAEALVEAGFAVEVIARGDKALARLAMTVPEIVILDMHLPGADGDRILHCICTDPRLARTRIVIASADTFMARTLDGEADLTLLKPVDFPIARPGPAFASGAPA